MPGAGGRRAAGSQPGVVGGDRAQRLVGGGGHARRAGDRVAAAVEMAVVARLRNRRAGTRSVRGRRAGRAAGSARTHRGTARHDGRRPGPAHHRPCPGEPRTDVGDRGGDGPDAGRDAARHQPRERLRVRRHHRSTSRDRTWHNCCRVRWRCWPSPRWRSPWCGGFRPGS